MTSSEFLTAAELTLPMFSSPSLLLLPDTSPPLLRFSPLCHFSTSPSLLPSFAFALLYSYYSTNDVTCARYASITEVPERAVELFGEDRRRTWALLFMSEVL